MTEPKLDFIPPDSKTNNLLKREHHLSSISWDVGGQDDPEATVG